MNDRSKCITQNYIASGRCCYRNKKKKPCTGQTCLQDRLISKLQKEFLKLNSKKTNNSTKKMGNNRDLTKEDMQV